MDLLDGGTCLVKIGQCAVRHGLEWIVLLGITAVAEDELNQFFSRGRQEVFLSVGFEH